MLSAIILAGGLGTRLRSEVPDRPKPMALVSGRPFLEYLLEYWARQGVGHVILAVGYLRDQIIGHFGRQFCGMSIDYSCEVSPLGTGGGILQAAQTISLDEYFLLLNGDTFFAVDLPALYEHARTLDADCSFSLFAAGETDRYMGIDLDADGRITHLKSSGSVAGRLANGGVYCMRRRVLMEDQFEQGRRLSFEDDVLPAAQAAGRRLLGKTFEAPFIDIGVPADYRRASEILCPIT